MLKFTCFLFLLFFNILVFGQKIETDRPDQTESSSTVPANRLQLESGILIGISEKKTTREQQILLPTNLIRLGLMKNVELRIISQFESVQNNVNKSHGISDLEIGTKIQLFHRENARTEAAIITHLMLPTGSKSLTNSTYGSISKISISHRLSDNFEFGYNIGYKYVRIGNGDLTYSFALGYNVNEKVGVYIEPFGEIPQFKTWISNADAGFTYLLKDNIQFDFSFGTGLNQRMNYLSIGMSWIFLSP